jgi:hypothetical protein
MTMPEPSELIRQLIEDCKAEGVKADAAAEAWSLKLPELERYVKALVAPFEHTGTPVAAGIAKQRVLVVQFYPRPLRTVQVSYGTKSVEEQGAILEISCNPEEGVVKYRRRPFLEEGQQHAPEPRRTLGSPHDLTKEQVGMVVAEFLRWAALGEGRGSKKLRLNVPAGARKRDAEHARAGSNGVAVGHP